MDLDETLRGVGMSLVVVSAVLSALCVIAHHVLARWWQTPAGRHVFIFEVVLAQVLGLWALRIFIPDATWFQAARLIAFALVPLVLLWRLAIIIGTWRRNRRARQGGPRREAPGEGNN